MCFRCFGQPALRRLPIFALPQVRSTPFLQIPDINRPLSINSALTSPGFLGLFSGFNIVAFVLVFLFVEETGRISLEDLDFIYNVPKSKFWRYQVFEYLPWLVGTYVPYLLRRRRRFRHSEDKESQGNTDQHPEPPRLYKPPFEAEDARDSASEDGDLHEFELRRLSSSRIGPTG